MKKGMQIPIQKPQKRQMRQKGKSTAVEEEEKFEAMGNEAEPTKKARELSSTELLRKGGCVSPCLTPLTPRTTTNYFTVAQNASKPSPSGHSLMRRCSLTHLPCKHF